MEKTLPNNIEAEEAILGSILLDSEALTEISDFLKPTDFYRDIHRTIYEAMIALNDAREPVDLNLLADELERKKKLDEVGGFGYLASFMNAVPTPGRVEYYARIVARTALHRGLIHAAGRMAALGYEEVPNAVELAEEMLFQLSQGTKTTGDIAIAESMSRYAMKLDTLYENRKNNVSTGVPTGYNVLDNILGGLQPSDLITLAARPGIGKTSLSLNIALNAMKKKYRIMFFSLEMGEEQMMRRLHSMETGIDQTRLRHGDLLDDPEDEWEVSTGAIGRLSDYQWWADYTAGISLQDMRTRARRSMSTHGFDLMIVDYLGLMTVPSTGNRKYENRVQEISTITRGLKELARELNVPVLMLAQLNRNIEQRAIKKPQLSDLRESGSIEQDSDVVLFLSAADDQQDKINAREKYIVDVSIAKHRNGPIGDTQLMFNPILTRFYNMEAEEY